ncbi:MAG TPA: hypothetical protein VHB20_00625 [Verrucomicrobiae bacterium]|jgi:hypothetical protein|nr:hypothetical protein [Verrucomicrobiae bacterium]
MRRIQNHARFEFYFANLDNHVLVERRDDEVVIRAARNNFSERRKSYFVRELAAEGHIPDSAAWPSPAPANGKPAIRWEIDHSWLKFNFHRMQRSSRFMQRLLLAAGATWMALVGLAFLR